MYGSIENYTFDPSALIEVSDILGKYNLMKLKLKYMCNNTLFFF